MGVLRVDREVIHPAALPERPDRPPRERPQDGVVARVHQRLFDLLGEGGAGAGAVTTSVSASAAGARRTATMEPLWTGNDRLLMPNSSVRVVPTDSPAEGSFAGLDACDSIV